MTDNSGPEPPIVVRSSAASDLAWNAVRSSIVAASMGAASITFHDALVTGAVATAVGAILLAIPGLVAFGVGMMKTLQMHHERRVLAEHAPDSVGRVQP